MDSATETAFFRGSDQDCLVAAALSCPMCLSGDVAWDLIDCAYEAYAECRCRHCGHERTVFLALEQALRLALHVDRPLDPTPRPEPELVAL
jgi:hypothetical protein